MKFVNKKLAIKLKEKGFDRPCFGWYYVENIDKEVNLNESFGTYEDCLYSNNRDELHYIGIVDRIDAPIIDQVLEWLREDCGLYISMACSRNYDIDADGRVLGSWVYWWYEIYSHLSADLIYQEEEKEYETYDEALLEGIEYVVEHLI